MISRLKSLELQGYKTFANRTEFEFPGAVTAIVGPNGSGKSNITDALRWVLGEQSYTLLRGKKTEDMIFAGSDRRTRSGMASATVVFDNSDNWLPIDFSEVAIARRAYRDGSNEYLLNGQRVRLKDVSELLSESGLAERTYTIIGQGLVDAALALRAEDRRRLFEEAAGIGLHRSRRREAVRRLEDTRRNLERVEDILSELRPRLRSLERQARRAQDYDQAVEDLKDLLREWYGFHWHRAQEELSLAQDRAKSHEGDLSAVREKEAEFDLEISQLRKKRHEIRNELSELHLKSTDLNSRREKTSRDLAVANERKRYLQEQEKNAHEAKNNLAEEIGLVEARFNFALEEVKRLKIELNEAKKNSENVEIAFSDRKAKREAIASRHSAASESLVNASSQQSTLGIQLSEKRAQVDHLRRSLEKANLELLGAREKLTSTEEKTQHDLSGISEHEDKVRELLNETKKIELTGSDLSGQAQALKDRLAGHETEMARLSAQSRVIEQAVRTYSGYSDGAKSIINEFGGSKSPLGILGHMIEVEERFEIAIGAALGEFVDGIVLTDQGETDQVLSFLEKSSGKAALIPLSTILQYQSAVDFLENENVFGVASKLVTISKDLEPTIELLLGNVLIVSDRQIARGVLNKFQASREFEGGFELRVVTLKGEVFHSGGLVRTSGKSEPVSISRRRELNEVNQKMEAASEEIRLVETQFTGIMKNLSTINVQRKQIDLKYKTQLEVLESKQDANRRLLLDLEQTRNEVGWREEQVAQLNKEIHETENQIQVGQLEIDRLISLEEAAKGKIEDLQIELEKLPLDHLQSDRSQWNTRIAVLEQAFREAQERLEERKQALDSITNRSKVNEENFSLIKNNQDALEAEIKSLMKSNLDLELEIESIRNFIKPKEDNLESIDEMLVSLQTEASNERRLSNQAEQNYAQARIAQVRKQEALDALRRQIEVDFGLVAFEYLDDVSGPTPLPFEGFIEDLPIITELDPGTEEALKRQRAHLRRIGPVNPEAQEEFGEVEERYNFLSSQMDDLREAAVDVQKVIEELDEIMEREFCNTFEEVAVEFHQIFGRLFGGGSAKLILTDPNDLTETGIDIEARLPGRREQGLSLLSGGERSLTAVALVFALLRVSPTPFCVLDEVDAMLDEANVGRFRELLRELSESTQFILITHNRASVQVADIIYGVTMGRDSTSKILSLKVDDLEKVV